MVHRSTSRSTESVPGVFGNCLAMVILRASVASAVLGGKERREEYKREIYRRGGTTRLILARFFLCQCPRAAGTPCATNFLYLNKQELNSFEGETESGPTTPTAGEQEEGQKHRFNWIGVANGERLQSACTLSLSHFLGSPLFKPLLSLSFKMPKAHCQREREIEEFVEGTPEKRGEVSTSIDAEISRTRADIESEKQEFATAEYQHGQMQ